jgi:organic radical activating enzyme|tara:strand:+ start:40564 stop:41937 length:1374 start_codon:yes stop_codon:yes gene_type:complete
MSNEQKIQVLEIKREQMNKVSCSFCTAKWLQTTLYLQNGFNHSCHHPAPHKIPLAEIELDPSALHNSKYKKEQREKMLKGERPKECDYCWNIEDLDNTYFSDRHYKTSDTWAWDRFEEIAKSDPNKNVYPSYLEVSFSNACNFACSYCSPEISSKWMEDINKYGQYPTKHGAHNLDYLKSSGKYPYKHSEDNPYVTAFWKWFPDALPYLKVFRITGGEPTMSKDTWKVLDYLLENPQYKIDIAINSNLGVPDVLIDKLIKKLNQLQEVGINVDIYTSIESTGEQAEYARDGLNYKQWLDNVNKVLELTKSKVAIMTTINILSLPTFTDFIKTLMDLRAKHNTSFEYNRVPLSVNYLRWPPHLQCSLLDTKERVKYANDIETICNSWLKYNSPEKFARLYLEEWDQIKRFCEYLKTQTNAVEHRKDFVKFISEYDKRRSKDFYITFKDYENLMETWSA